MERHGGLCDGIVRRGRHRSYLRQPDHPAGGGSLGEAELCVAHEYQLPGTAEDDFLAARRRPADLFDAERSRSARLLRFVARCGAVSCRYGRPSHLLAWSNSVIAAPWDTRSREKRCFGAQLNTTPEDFASNGRSGARCHSGFCLLTSDFVFSLIQQPAVEPAVSEVERQPDRHPDQERSSKLDPPNPSISRKFTSTPRIGKTGTHGVLKRPRQVRIRPAHDDDAETHQHKCE